MSQLKSGVNLKKVELPKKQKNKKKGSQLKSWISLNEN